MKVFALLLSALLVIPAFAGPKDVSVKTIKTVKQGVVPVVCGFLNEKNELQIVKIIASGFFINNQGGFLTARHVLSELRKVSTKERPCFPAIYIPIGGWEKGKHELGTRWFKFTSCLIKNKLDIASCSLINNPFQDAAVSRHIVFLRFENSFSYKDGTPIAFTGFPLYSTIPVTSKGIIASYRAVAKEMVVDKNAWPGASGSPVYIANGRVIGMIIKRGIGAGIGLAYARPGDLIIKFLREEKITMGK